MKNYRKIYSFISLMLFLVTIIILSVIDKTNNIKLSLTIQIILITYLLKITWGCILYIKKQYQKNTYSYEIVMNLGLVLFLIINIIRQIILLLLNLNETNINNIYNNTLNSFSYFAFFVLPLIFILFIYSIISNIFLIIKENFKIQNVLNILFGILIFIVILLSQNIYAVVKNIELIDSQLYIKKFIDVDLNSILCYLYCLILATLYCNIIAVKHKPTYDKDFIIILGAKVKDDGSLTPVLKARVDKAIEFAKEQKEHTKRNIIFIPSGGMGVDETISEGEAMKNYLIENGISPEDIVVENKSTNTFQNIKFSKQIIDKNNKNGNIVFSTTNYHVYRSGAIANSQEIKCEGIGSKTKWYFYANAFIREFMANFSFQWKQHLCLVILINVFIFILIFIGYKYNLV